MANNKVPPIIVRTLAEAYSDCIIPLNTFLVIVSPSKSIVCCIALTILITFLSRSINFTTTLPVISTPLPRYPLLTGTTSTAYPRSLLPSLACKLLLLKLAQHPAKDSGRGLSFLRAPSIPPGKAATDIGVSDIILCLDGSLYEESPAVTPLFATQPIVDDVVRERRYLQEKNHTTEGQEAQVKDRVVKGTVMQLFALTLDARKLNKRCFNY